MEKTFKIGECAIGGRIKVNANKDFVQIFATDWTTWKVIKGADFSKTDVNLLSKVKNYLEDISNFYHAERMFKSLQENGMLPKEVANG